MSYAAQAGSLFDAILLANTNVGKHRVVANTVAKAAFVLRTQVPTILQRKIALVKSTIAPMPELVSAASTATLHAGFVVTNQAGNEANSIEQAIWGACWFLLGLLFLCTA